MSEIGLMSPPRMTDPVAEDDGRDEAACRVCGCTFFDPCDEGCWWVQDPKSLGPLCSSCEDQA